MYSDYKSVQILIALLKKYSVRNIVMSPGGSDIPIIHSIENDNFFKCYSVVDERSAVYFGIGISQVINEPVACVCTSGTAVSNYLAGMTEAFYQDVPIIAITADKDPYLQGQLETQKIEQKNIFDKVSKKSVDLPLCKSKDEIWYCERLVKEALVSALYHGKGPVHINIPVVGSYAHYNVVKLPEINLLDIVNAETSEDIWKKYLSILVKAHKILIVVGEDVIFSYKDITNIEKFFDKFNCAISVEHSSNLKCNGTVFTYPVTETGNTTQELIPDIVISLGNNMVSYGLKPFLRKNAEQFQHYAIDEGGRIRDVFKSLRTVFECTHTYFFKYFIDNAPAAIRNDKQYYKCWEDVVKKIKIPDFPFSNFYVAKKLASQIPSNSILHLAILNSTRIMQFFELKDNVRVFVNAGALGIDGCLSTFIGHSSATKELSFCVIGDLSFFYDMNAAGIAHVGSNVRIILLNNGGGAEFHFFNKKQDIPTLNKYICAEHCKTAKGWIESLGYSYYSVSSKKEFDDVLNLFIEENDSPKFLEIFTNMEEDTRITREFYDANRRRPTLVEKAKSVGSKVKHKFL